MQRQRTVQDYEWQIFRTQFEGDFKVYHPIPEDHLRIEIAEYWEGRRDIIHGWSDIPGQVVDAILAPIRWMIDNVMNAIWGAARWITDQVSSAFTWTWENLIRPGMDLLLTPIRWVIDGVKALANGIWGTVQDIWNVMAGITSTIWNAVTSAVSIVWDWLITVKDLTVSALKTSFDWIADKVTSGLGLIAGAFEAVASAIWDGLATFGTFILDGLRKAFDFFKGVGEWIFDAIKKYVIDPVAGLITGAVDAITGWFTSSLNTIIGGPVTHSPIEIEGSLMRWLSIAGVTGATMAIGRVGMMVIDAVHPFKSIGMADAFDHVAELAGPAVFMTKFVGSFLDIAMVTPLKYDLNAMYKPMVPGMMDLVRMEVREVWRPEFRAEQLEERPSGDFLKWAGYQGFAEEHADSYWAAHWSLITTGQAFEMYHRLREGRTTPDLLFTRDDLLKLLRRQDVLKRYRDQLIAIAYEVPTRREIRMMMQAGVIDRTEAEQLYLDRGVDPHFAPMLADFAAARAMTDPYRGRWITSAMRHFREGYVDEDGFKKILAVREVPKDLAESSLEFAQLDREYDYKSDLLAMNRDLFRHGKLTEEEYHTRLSTIGLNEERIEVVLERDKLRIKVSAAETEEAAAAKPLTRSDVLRLYQTRVKDDEWARDQLELRGYTIEDVDSLLDLYSPEKPEVGGRSLSRAMLDRLFKEGIIDDDYYMARLLDMGYGEVDAWLWYRVQLKAAAPKEGEVEA